MPLANGAEASPSPIRAEVLALRALVEQTRRDLNAQLDRLAEAVERLLFAEDASSQPSTEPVGQLASRAVLIGQDVYVPRLGRAFPVVEVSSSGQTLTVQRGTLRLRVRRNEVEIREEPIPKETRSPAGEAATTRQPDLNARIPEIDLHGFSAQEALVTLELFLHQEFKQRTLRVRVIHGKGAGILRAAVRRELSRHPLVRAIDSGPHYQGGDGVTLVDLDV